ncbi:PilW family protein [Bacillus sp. NP157]|nr:PilW family protein [Bacillus sp. NP157]
MTRTPIASSKRGAAGFSLIELMVGTVIAIICTVGVLTAFAAFEGQKRTTTNGSDAQQNGSYAAFTLERELRTAGSDIVQGKNYGVWGCTLQTWSGGTQRLPLTTALAAPFANWPLKTRAVPVLIAAGTGDVADAIGIVRGNAIARTFRTNLVSATSNKATVDNGMAIFPNEYLLLSDKSGTCTMAKISSIDVAGTTMTFDTNNSDSTSFAGHYTGAGYVFDMGITPAVTLYSVNQTNFSLVSYDLLQVGNTASTNQPAISLADNVVQMKALYGISATVNDLPIASWVKPTGNTWAIGKLMPDTDTAAALNARGQIRAIRIAVVVRSRQQERAPAGSGTVAGRASYIGYSGPTSLTLFGDLDATLQYTVTTDASYRYKVYDFVVPVRNSLITKFF